MSVSLVQWEGDEPYLQLPNGFRVTSLRDNAQDVAAAVELSNDPAISTYSFRRPFPYTEQDARSWYDLNYLKEEDREALRNGKQLELSPFRVIREGSGPGIGDTGFWVIEESKDGKPRVWGLGYTLHPRYHRRGVASSAVAAVLDWARTQWPGDVVRAGIEPRNAASSALAKKLGFKLVRTFTMEWTRGPPRQMNEWELVL